MAGIASRMRQNGFDGLKKKVLTLAFIMRDVSSTDNAGYTQQKLQKQQVETTATKAFEATRNPLLLDVQVLLGKKQRGLGCGMWNGFGGKVEPSDESIASAAAREILEECHLQVHTKDLEKRGILTFSFVGSEEILQVNIFVTKKFEGNPLESDEMLSPQWFYLHQLPFNQMWSDDQYWLPHVMNGKKVYGHFHFDQDQATILDYDLDIIPTATV